MINHINRCMNSKICIMPSDRFPDCRMHAQGYPQGRCLVDAGHDRLPACQVTLKIKDHKPYRRISAVHLSRPENYLSIYQSGCNFACRKCHSWYFSKVKEGGWYSPQNILAKAMRYEQAVTLWERREKATAWHAHDSCRCCGSCILKGTISEECPGVLKPEAITLGPQGFGPARNIVAFTGGDISCRPEFYGQCARLIKSHTKLWMLLETNGYGLTPPHLDYLKESGIDAFWLDIKAYDAEKHKWLTGCDNDHILQLPREIIGRDFVLKVLSLFIPGLVENDELANIARLLARVDACIPFTILAFFPEYQMKNFARPTVRQMVAAYDVVTGIGLQNVRLGNIGVFAPTADDRQFLHDHVPETAY